MAAFVFSLLAGLWMLIMGGVTAWNYSRGHAWGGSGAFGWAWHHHHALHGYGGGLLWSWIGMAMGIFIVVGISVVLAVPAIARVWGWLIIGASVIDLLAGAGGFLAVVLGVIGGILAIVWQPGPP